MSEHTLEIKPSELLAEAMERKANLVKELSDVEAEIRIFNKLLLTLKPAAIDIITATEGGDKRRKPIEKWLKVLCYLQTESASLDDLYKKSNMENTVSRQNFDIQLRRYRELDLLLKTDGKFRLTNRAKAYVSEYLEANPEFAALIF